MVEFDQPRVLLSRYDSYFSRMVEQTGPTEAEYLRTLANSERVYSNRRDEFTSTVDEAKDDDAKETDPFITDGKSP